jgi:RimJ/RimL family protein N-acetyltransferase
LSQNINLEFRSRPKFETIEASKDWLLFQLPNEINTEIDKFAIFLKDSILETEKDAEERSAEKIKRKPKMIGFLGTNRWSDDPDVKAMEVGYCFNIDYWGKGYATESLAAFLSWLWAQPRMLLPYSKNSLVFIS